MCWQLRLPEADAATIGLLIFRGTQMSDPHRLDEMLGKARLAHRQGRLDEAEQLYSQLLPQDSIHFDALHGLAVVALQRGDLDLALQRAQLALQVRPESQAALSSVGAILVALKRYDEALAAYDRVIEFNADDATAHCNRAHALAELGRFKEALLAYDKAIALKPDLVEALFRRGNVLLQLQQFDAALASFDRAMFSLPGDARLKLRWLDAALTGFDEAIAVKNNYATAFSHRGNALFEMQQLDAALANYDMAIALKPDFAEAYFNRGNALLRRLRLDAALASYERAILLKADFSEAYCNRGKVLVDLRQTDAALASFDQAIALNRNYAEAHSNRGNALLRLKRLDAALASYDTAIALKPDFAEAYFNRAIVLADLKRPDAALASYEAAIALNPNDVNAFGGIADAAVQSCDWRRMQEVEEMLERKVSEGRAVISPFRLLAYPCEPATHLDCARTFVRHRLPAPAVLPPQASPRKHHKIRVAYLSGDFHSHPIARLVAELFEVHDRTRFEVLGISFGPDDGSDLRRRVAAGFDTFMDVRHTSDFQVASLLRSRKVDIAIDLMGYTADCRCEILAHRPAPVQAAYLGFPGTMGAHFIDYVIADAIVLPFDQQSYYTEKIVHLPECYQVNDSKRAIAAATLTRKAAGLPETGFVFCCFNNNYKITPQLFDIWMKLLQQFQDSVLWLLHDNDAARRNLCSEAAARGIAPARLIFAQWLPSEQHLARHRLADIFLDTLPYNAHTTASDALWTGLPLITCMGNTFAGRVGASLLHAIGLDELITKTLAEYEALARRLAGAPQDLRSIQKKLRENRLTYPLFATKRFARHIEAAYVHMWEQMARGLPPESFTVRALP
jgi:protein O-GlcNAc transferase